MSAFTNMIDLGNQDYDASQNKPKLKFKTQDERQAAANQMPGQEPVNTTTSPLMNQLYDKGGRVGLPRIDLNDGKHKMIVAEDGERVLTPAQNREYEAQHPDARKEPMKAQVYDGGGSVKTPSLTDRIKSRAVQLYNQGQALSAPEDTEAEAFQQKQQNVDSSLKPSTEMQPLAPKPAMPVAADRVNPSAAYGSRPGEQRIDTTNMLKPLGVAYDSGGIVSVYDDSGVVSTDHESDDPAKEAAYHQAAAEVHAEEAAKMRRFPQPQSGPARIQSDTDMPEAPQGSRMNIDNAKSGGPDMNMDNTPYPGFFQNEDPDGPHVPFRPAKEGAKEPEITESSMKTSLGPKVAVPGNTQMRNLPGIETPKGNGTTDQPMDSENEASARAAGYPVQHTANGEPDIQSIIQQAKIAAAKKGHAGTADLGLAMIHENAFKEDAPPLAPVDPNLAQPGLPAPTKGEHPEVAKRVVTMRLLRDKMLYAPTEQERFQAEKDLAELKRRTPWGSAENHPGVLGKIAHVASEVGQAALRPIAPYVADYIPGSKVDLARQAARGEQGVEQAQEKQYKGAQPELAQEKQALAEQKVENEHEKNINDMVKHGWKQNPETGLYDAPAPYDQLSTEQKAVYDKGEAYATLQKSKAGEQEAKAVLERYKADPTNPQNQAALERVRIEAQKAAIAAEGMGIKKKTFMADYYGMDEQGNPLAGVQTTAEGKPIGPKISGKGGAGGPLAVKGVQARNVQDNLNKAIDIIQENPELFGKVQGRFTTTREMLGSDDAAIRRLANIIHNAALASTSVHGLRGEKAVEATEKDILNNFKDSPEATIAGMQDTIDSMGTFTDAATKGATNTINAPKASAAKPPQGMPSGATHTGRGSVDKKLHWLDAQGNDLGLKEEVKK